MSTHKAGGKASQHVSPEGKRLGIKITDGQNAKPGMILIRQRGSGVKAGMGVKMGRDFTLYAMVEGTVKYFKKLGKKMAKIVTK
jgi:large subunit ribosomal protein L27